MIAGGLAQSREGCKRIPNLHSVGKDVAKFIKDYLDARPGFEQEDCHV